MNVVQVQPVQWRKISVEERDGIPRPRTRRTDRGWGEGGRQLYNTVVYIWFTPLPRFPNMMASSVSARTKSPKPKDKSRTISSFDAAIGIFNTIKDTVEIVPAKGVFGSAATILGLIRVRCFVAPMSTQMFTRTNETVRTR